MDSNNFIPLSKDDVIRGIETAWELDKTFTIEDLLEELRTKLDISNQRFDQFNWIGEGMECELLRASGNESGWKAGKVRVHIEFCEAQLKPSENESSATSLDSLRADS